MRSYDVAILNGRVVDPESNLDAVRNIGITKGTIQAITTEKLQGRTAIEARRLIVSPGFIDLHVHLNRGQDQINFSVKAMDGVTTALDLESGTRDVDEWYAMRQGKTLINYGTSVSHAGVRMKVMRGPDPIASTSDAAKRAASKSEIEEIRHQIEQGLERGAIGVGLLLPYAPATTREEILEVFRAAAKFGVPCYVHIRFHSIQGLREVIDATETTRASLHIVHINSVGSRDSPRFLQVIGEARSRGLDITTECYPYTAGAAGIDSPFFDEGWQGKFGIDYKDLEWAVTGETLTEQTFKLYRGKGGLVIVHGMSEDRIEFAVTSPLTMIASDSLLMNGRGHPRSSGTFSRVLGRYVREKKALTLMEALGKMTLMPAQRLEGRVPRMKDKGRIRVGGDADITIFDPERVIDKATFKEPTKYSEGILNVLVNGVLVVKDGQLQSGVTPGRPIRAAIK
jgi:N-acyl-D-aspartate/D-glutamate deacylase